MGTKAKKAPAAALTKAQLDAIAKRISEGSTVLGEARKLGHKRSAILRAALRAHLKTAAAYQSMMRGKKGGKAAKAAPVAKAKAGKPKAQAVRSPQRKAASKRSK